MRAKSVNTRQTGKVPIARKETRTCDVADEDLVAYAEGDLGGARGEWVETHLRVCSHCRGRFATFAEVDEILRQAPPPADDPDRRAWMRTHIQGDVTHRHARWRSFLPWSRRYRPRWPRTLVVTLALKLVLIGLILWPGLDLDLTYLRVSIVLATVAVIASLAPLRDDILE